ncbi:hypothetical protein L226DRAFT_535315 [Lentinus tigrinus ALCF2SS1-7]|uniref:Uncharacterized protein n=1 Tax=Lentinus tigrinus ALCF2SS1-6 TaxID=1328759 RepID=A0A5C2SDX4_9APHY|nr:hypothetical protein L227DRAFT_599887 [Lentinus tigrinus ALCF2SS1-6]RPD74437.1 hypothetical protein L226DRAFT_535315 [Lentinus tigrinus ALCF2SS1-7]
MSTPAAPQQQANPPSTSVSKGSKTNASAPRSSTISTAKPKKDVPKAQTSAMPAPVKTQGRDHMKKVSRRASKPIINWFQRKLAGTRRQSDAQRYGASSPRGKESKQHRRTSVPTPPPLSIQSRTRSNTVGSRQNRSRSLRGTISLNETIDDADSRSYETDSDDGLHSSVARESLYSPASYLEADEDASVRPLPPSSPPSPSPSRDSSSYLSHSRTFRSVTASTKPTTLLSVDLTGGMAHIAQAPPTPTTPGHRLPPHIRTHSSGPSAGSITFSAFLPPSPTSPSRPSSDNSGTMGANLTAPLYTTHHPRNNPRPSSPPPDDASVLTLASSAFGMPGARIGVSALALSGHASIADDSISQWSNAAGLTDSTSHFMMGELEEGAEEGRYFDHDVDASVRALRPRSSRRGSWDSMVSGWSANVPGSAVGAPSPGGIRSKSLWTSGSYRTGGMSTEDALGDAFPESEEQQDADTKGDDAEAKQTADSASSAATDGQTRSSVTVDPSTDSTQGAKTPPAPSIEIQSSVLTLPGSKANVPVDMASTVTLAGSKAGSDVPSPDQSSVAGHKSSVSTPTKVESNPVELESATAVLSLQEANDVKKSVNAEVQDADRRASLQFGPLSPASTAHTEYLSAPSTPAAL